MAKTDDRVKVRAIVEQALMEAVEPLAVALLSTINGKDEGPFIQTRIHKINNGELGDHGEGLMITFRRTPAGKPLTKDQQNAIDYANNT